MSSINSSFETHNKDCGFVCVSVTFAFHRGRGAINLLPLEVLLRGVEVCFCSEAPETVVKGGDRVLRRSGRLEFGRAVSLVLKARLVCV